MECFEESRDTLIDDLLDACYLVETPYNLSTDPAEKLLIKAKSERKIGNVLRRHGVWEDYEIIDYSVDIITEDGIMAETIVVIHMVPIGSERNMKKALTFEYHMDYRLC